MRATANRLPKCSDCGRKPEILFYDCKAGPVYLCRCSNPNCILNWLFGREQLTRRAAIKDWFRVLGMTHEQRMARR